MVGQGLYPRFDIVEYLPTHETKDYTTRSLKDITGIVVHHTATGQGYRPLDAAEYHVNTKDYPGIAYHSMIAPDGTRFKTNYDSTISYHAGAECNVKTIGIALIGNFDRHRLTVDQKFALLEELELYGVAYRVEFSEVVGHRSCMSTRCPGKHLDMDLVRASYRFVVGL